MIRGGSFQRRARIVLMSLFSRESPSICESHAISVLAGCLGNALGKQCDALKLIDLYAMDRVIDDNELLEVISRFRPTIVGISVPYGSYDYLKNIYPKLKTLLKSLTAYLTNVPQL